MFKEEGLAEILEDFVVEARENLEQFELALLELEADPSQEEPLQALFRNVHSIKGSCSFFQLTKIEAVTHSAESLLDRIRDRQIALNAEITSALLWMVDVVRSLLGSVESDKSDGSMDVTGLVLRLDALAEARLDPRPSQPAELSPHSIEELRALVTRDNKVRVDTHLLERLMNLVGELVLSRNQIAQHAAAQQNQAISIAAQRLSLVTSEIQEVVMKTRMQPIGQVFSRFPRLVRDLAKQCDKELRIDIDGKETELDKTLIEAIQDPLTHLVRNAADHGIEAASLRKKLGKPRAGHIMLRAYHEAGMVNIEIADDGAGIDTDAVRKKAIAQARVTPDAAARMSEREIWGFLFAPGFSTQDTVTHVSGRGVGMDVVKTNIEKIGGSVDLLSEAGQGTTVKIKIPLTLAIIPALIVSSGGERFAIPQASLLEVVRFERDDPQRRIEVIQGAPVLRLRGHILPLIDLAQELGQTPLQDPHAQVAIVVLQTGGHSFGLVVEAINDTEEIVVKPLWKRLKGIPYFAGATVMGDGRVALILEPVGLAQRAGVLADRQVARSRAGRASEERSEVEGPKLDQVLLCRVGAGRLAIPLSKVARLEDLPVERIERSGPLEVTQYRDQILPLVRVAPLLEERRKRPRGNALAPDGSVPVVVYSHEDRSIGLVVDGIVDITELTLCLQRGASRRGILGSMVVQGWVTEFLDVEGVIRMAEPAFFDGPLGA